MWVQPETQGWLKPLGRDGGRQGTAQQRAPIFPWDRGFGRPQPPGLILAWLSPPSGIFPGTHSLAVCSSSCSSWRDPRAPASLCCARLSLVGVCRRQCKHGPLPIAEAGTNTGLSSSQQTHPNSKASSQE